jgi:hypothetical protein
VWRKTEATFAFAAIDVDDLASDERDFYGGCEYDAVGDLFRPADAFKRHAGDQLGLPVGIAREASSIAVSIGPGATALTRTPNAAPSNIGLSEARRSPSVDFHRTSGQKKAASTESELDKAFG